MKIRMILLMGSLTFSALVIFGLYTNWKKNERNNTNNFNRLILNDIILSSKIYDIKYNSYYIAGVTSSQVYLGNLTAPLHVLMVNSSQATDTQHIQLKIKDLSKLNFRAIRITIDSPYFYISDKAVRTIFSGTITDWYANPHLQKKGHFTEVIPINHYSFAGRNVGKSLEFVLGKLINIEPYTKLAPGLLEKQLDGFFCTDGMLNYNSELAHLVYVYYYRNQFICIDTNMNLLYRSNTIDTISKVRIKVAEIHSEKSRTLSTPPRIVNKKSTTFGNWLFVNSDLLSKNESRDLFERSSIIDVYNLRDAGNYRFSFYLPDFKKQKMADLYVYKNMAVALYDHYMIIYQLNLSSFRKFETNQDLGKQ